MRTSGKLSDAIHHSLYYELSRGLDYGLGDGLGDGLYVGLCNGLRAGTRDSILYALDDVFFDRHNRAAMLLKTTRHTKL